MILRNTSFGHVGSVLSRHAGNQKTSSADCVAMGGPVGKQAPRWCLEWAQKCLQEADDIDNPDVVTSLETVARR
jgi:hypothetical protein